MSLTLNEALAELKNNPAKYSTADGLLTLVKQVSLGLPGATANSITLLYSGKVTDGGVGSTEIAEFIGDKSGGAVRTVGQTDAGKFLASEEFDAFARSVFGSGDALKTFLYDGQSGAWATISRPFVDGECGRRSPFNRRACVGTVSPL